jgi:hypothetical protein
VVAWGAAERPDHGEAKASARRRKEGSGAGVSGVAGLGLGFWGSGVLFVGWRRCLGVRAQAGSRRPGTSEAVARRGRRRTKGPTGGVEPGE